MFKVNGIYLQLTFVQTLIMAPNIDSVYNLFISVFIVMPTTQEKTAHMASLRNTLFHWPILQKAIQPYISRIWERK